MKTLLTRGLAACALLALPLSSHVGAQDAIDVSGRVARILKAMLKASSVAVKESSLGSANPMIRINNRRQKPKPVITQYTRVGDLEAWTKLDGKQVLGRRGARWVHKNQDGGWSPSVRPQSPMWAAAFLCDPSFLAERLLAAGADLKWQLEEAGEIDSRPMRKYSCKLDKRAGRPFVRSGALPGATGAGGANQIVFLLAGAGRNIRRPEADIRFEIDLYEDPAKRLPGRIVVRSYSKNPNQVGGAVVFGGLVQQGAQDEEEEDDEEEDEDNKKEKPTNTMTFDFSDWNRASIEATLPAAAVEALSDPHAALKKAAREAGEKRKKRGAKR